MKGESESKVDPPYSRVWRVFGGACFYVPVAGLFWLSTLFFHECGHIFAAILSGGTLSFVDVYPWHLSQTQVSPNPHPSLVVWAGLLSGWFVPLLTIPLWHSQMRELATVLKAWAGFCWFSMGLYLALAAGEPLSDAGQLNTAGWPVSFLVAVGLCVAVVGYRCGRDALLKILTIPKRELCSVINCSAAWAVFVLWWTLQWACASQLSSWSS